MITQLNNPMSEIRSRFGKKGSLAPCADAPTYEKCLACEEAKAVYFPPGSLTSAQEQAMKSAREKRCRDAIAIRSRRSTTMTGMESSTLQNAAILGAVGAAVGYLFTKNTKGASIGAAAGVGVSVLNDTITM